MKIENTKKVSLAKCSLQRGCVEDYFVLVGQQNRNISWYIIDYGIYGIHYVSTFTVS
jgi:hypothetical protein